MAANLPEIERFARHVHDGVAAKLLTLLAILLELPTEDSLLRSHRYAERSDCHLRYMKYHRRSPEQNAELGDVWVKGHTDFGSLTLLFRQPVAALQVRGPPPPPRGGAGGGAEESGGSGAAEWKWVRPQPGSITVNLADSLEFLTSGFLKSSIHRVVAPPPDQRDLDRLGVLYFVRPEDSTPLRPLRDSGLLRRLGLGLGADETTGDDEESVITAGQWVKARVAKGAARTAGARSETAVQEIVGGKSAKYYD